MENAALLAGCIVTTLFIGLNVLYLISGKRGFGELYLLEKIGLSYLLGLGAVTLEMFALSFFDIGFTRFTILAPWLVLVVINAATNPVDLVGRRGRRPTRSTGLVAAGLLLIPIAIQGCYNFFRALIKPIEAYDSVSIYGLKAKIIYLAGGIKENFFQGIASNFQGAHADYPLFIPLSEVWVYTFLGRFDDILVKVLFPLFWLAALFVFYSFMKRITKNANTALILTFFLATVKQFSDYSTIGVADMELGIYFGLAVGYIYLWVSENRFHFAGGNAVSTCEVESGSGTAYLNIALFSAILCLWTKNEGTLLALIAAAVLFLYGIFNFRRLGARKLTRIGIFVIIVLIAIFSWNAFRNSEGLVNENFNLSMINPGEITANLNKIPVILYEYQKEFFGFKKWNIVWILLFTVFIWRFKDSFSGGGKYVTLALFFFAGGYFLMYMFAGVDIAYFAEKTASRFLLHVLPLALVWIGIILRNDEESNFSRQRRRHK